MTYKPVVYKLMRYCVKNYKEKAMLFLLCNSAKFEVEGSNPFANSNKSNNFDCFKRLILKI